MPEDNIINNFSSTAQKTVMPELQSSQKVSSPSNESQLNNTNRQKQLANYFNDNWTAEYADHYEQEHGLLTDFIKEAELLRDDIRNSYNNPNIVKTDIPVRKQALIDKINNDPNIQRTLRVALLSCINDTMNSLPPAESPTTSAPSGSIVPQASSNGILSLQEQQQLAAWAPFAVPGEYYPPLLLTDTGSGDFSDAGLQNREGFIFLNVGDLKLEDGTYPRNVPILRVPDGDIDAVQDLGFGSGTIRLSGRFWAQAGMQRLESLRRLCMSRRPLIFISQETGAWKVFPMNVPGVSTAAGQPYQYYFDVQFACVGKINEKTTAGMYESMRKLVESKLSKEKAILDGWQKLGSLKAFTGLGVKEDPSNPRDVAGFYFDPVTGKFTNTPPAGQQTKDMAAKTTSSDPQILDNTTATENAQDYRHGYSISSDSRRREQEGSQNIPIPTTIDDAQRFIDETSQEAARIAREIQSRLQNALGMPTETPYTLSYGGLQPTPTTSVPTQPTVSSSHTVDQISGVATGIAERTNREMKWTSKNGTIETINSKPIAQSSRDELLALNGLLRGQIQNLTHNNISWMNSGLSPNKIAQIVQTNQARIRNLEQECNYLATAIASRS